MLMRKLAVVSIASMLSVLSAGPASADSGSPTDIVFATADNSVELAEAEVANAVLAATNAATGAGPSCDARIRGWVDTPGADVPLVGYVSGHAGAYAAAHCVDARLDLAPAYELRLAVHLQAYDPTRPVGNRYFTYHTLRCSADSVAGIAVTVIDPCLVHHEYTAAEQEIQELARRVLVQIENPPGYAAVPAPYVLPGVPAA